MKNLFTPKQKQKQKKNKNKKQTKKSLLLLEDNFKYNVSLYTADVCTIVDYNKCCETSRTIVTADYLLFVFKVFTVRF